MDHSTYNDHAGAMAIDFYGHHGFKTRLVVNVQVSKDEKEITISYPLALFVNYNEIARTVLYKLGYAGSPGSIGASPPGEDPENWKENNFRARSYNNTGNGRCYIQGYIFSKLKNRS